MKLPITEIIEREPWGMSGNEVSEFWGARARYIAAMKAAIWWVEEHENDFKSGEELNKAIIAKDAMNRAYNRANNASFRTAALIREVRALRSGVGISYATEEADPVSDDFAMQRGS